MKEKRRQGSSLKIYLASLHNSKGPAVRIKSCVAKRIELQDPFDEREKIPGRIRSSESVTGRYS